jgi:hypothetical protein
LSFVDVGGNDFEGDLIADLEGTTDDDEVVITRVVVTTPLAAGRVEVVESLLLFDVEVTVGVGVVRRLANVSVGAVGGL